jgi:hypothetical protein
MRKKLSSRRILLTELVLRPTLHQDSMPLSQRAC